MCVNEKEGERGEEILCFKSLKIDKCNSLELVLFDRIRLSKFTYVQDALVQMSAFHTFWQIPSIIC